LVSWQEHLLLLHPVALLLLQQQVILQVLLVHRHQLQQAVSARQLRAAV